MLGKGLVHSRIRDFGARDILDVGSWQWTFGTQYMRISEWSRDAARDPGQHKCEYNLTTNA